MSKNINNFFKELKVFRATAVEHYNTYNAKIKDLDVHKGSTYYTQETEKAEKALKESLTQARIKARDALLPVLTQMRIDAGKNLVQQPTTEMVNALSLLNMTDKLSTLEVDLYAEMMKDCPLALRNLRTIAAKHNIIMGEPNLEIPFNRINKLEGHAAYYLEQFNPNELNERGTVTMRLMDRTLTPTAGEKEEELFLYETTGSTDRTSFEPNGSSPAPKAQYKFSDLDELIFYMGEACKGENAIAQEIIKETILKDCPENYGAVYRNYKATGEKLPLNEEETA